jgi:hypothetical protein
MIRRLVPATMITTALLLATPGAARASSLAGDDDPTSVPSYVAAAAILLVAAAAVAVLSFLQFRRGTMTPDELGRAMHALRGYPTAPEAPAGTAPITESRSEQPFPPPTPQPFPAPAPAPQPPHPPVPAPHLLPAPPPSPTPVLQPAVPPQWQPAPAAPRVLDPRAVKGATESTRRYAVGTPVPHRAYTLDVDAFARELRPTLDQAVTHGHAPALQAFIQANLPRLTDLRAGAVPLVETWGRTPPPADPQELAALALTAYYLPHHDVGLGALWQDAVLDLNAAFGDAGGPIVLGAAMGAFDPGRRGSYLLTWAIVREHLTTLTRVPARTPAIDAVHRMLAAADRAGRGLYVTF